MRPLVVVRAGGTDHVHVLVGPAGEGLHDVEQGAAGLGEGVFDAGRHGGVDRTGDDAVAFQSAQGGTEHALGDSVAGPAQLVETMGPLPEAADDDDGPLVAHAVEDVAHEGRPLCGRVPGPGLIHGCSHRFLA